MEDWKEYKLGDLLTIKYGKDHKKLKEGNIPVYGSGGIMRRVNQSIYDGPSIMIPRKGSLNNVLYSDTPFWTVDTMFWSIINDNIVNPLFLYYSLCKKDFASLNVGSAVPSLTVPILNDIDVNVPTFDTQNRIVGILKSLDDKIELNRRINDNLEQQAQALFKAWFVDFEPFKDGKFVDSELGRIPEGWKIVEANYFMTISKESINPTKNPTCLYTHYSIPAFDEALTPEIQYGRKIKSNKFLVYSGMILFSKLNPRIKRIWFIDEAPNNSICSTEFIPYKSLGANCYFLYCYLNSKMFYDQAMSLVNGATGSHQRFHPNETLKFLFAYKKGIVEEFNAIVTPTLKEMSKLSIENRKLTRLRDTLLPRLMSGELSINTNN